MEDRTAELAGLKGSGYAVVESLTSLGKGKRCDGIFVLDADDRDRVDALVGSGETVPFEGTVYHRHHENRMELKVRVTRVVEGGHGITAEFTARDEF